MSTKKENNSDMEDNEQNDNEIRETNARKIVKKMFPGIVNDDIELVKGVPDNDGYETCSDSDYSGNENSDSEYDDIENIDWENFKFNIVVSMDDLDIQDLPDDYDNEHFEENDSDYEYTSDENEVIENYVKPITRSKKKILNENSENYNDNGKNNQNPKKHKSKPLNKSIKKKSAAKSLKNNKKKEEKKDNTDSKQNDTLINMLEAYEKGNTEFMSHCTNVIKKHKEEQKRKEKIKKEKEEKKSKNDNNKEFRKLLRGQQYSSEIKYFNKLSTDKQKIILKKFNYINEKSKIDVPYKISIINSQIPDDFKVHALKKISSLEYMDQSSGEYYKIKQWIDTFMKIPFGKYTNLPINLKDSESTKIQDYMEESINKLNSIVYGLDDAKYQIIQMIGQWISNPKSIGNAIAIKGPMGTGKTTLVKEGVSKILNRPFAFIALGGATDSSFLEGHSYTYEGSIWGKIVDILIQSKCMNPVIYFDELDKISDTPRGEEIIGILTHLTDVSQNDQFHDKYFSGIDFDLSRALFIFSYNDEDKINPILKDRMYHIETKGYDNGEKNIIANKYLLPKIRENVLFNDGDIIIDDDVLEYINNTFTKKEKGVRNLKRCLEIIHTKINLYRLLKPDTELFNNEKSLKIEFPFKITKEHIDNFIKLNNGTEPPFNMYT